MINHSIILVIENTGASVASNIQISVDSIENNGDADLCLDDLFRTPFELHPHEIVQGLVALSGETISTSVFPKIFVHVSYIREDTEQHKAYERTVICDVNYSKHLTDKEVRRLEEIKSDMDCIARATVRIANYLDGHQIAKMDELDLLAGRSLYNDLASLTPAGQSIPLVSREESIKKRIIPNCQKKSEKGK